MPYPLAERSFQWGYGGVQGGLRGEIEIFPGPPAKKVIKMLICYLFVSTPQSIAKPSPGWNKVALLTAVRNSPCSCPFSVSLTRPQDALNFAMSPANLAGQDRPGKIENNRMAKKKNSPFGLFFSLVSGSYLSSRAVSSQVLSAEASLTSVFGMGTGGPSP